MASDTGAYSKPAEFEEKTTPDNKWYDPEIRDRMDTESMQFYTQCTGLSGDELTKHIHKNRDHAWTISPWPYIGQWSFLSTRIRLLPSLSQILQSLESGGRHLDLGCGLGQDLRYLVHLGAPSTNMYASDLLGAFWDAGYDLFRDKDTFSATFAQANILEDENALRKNAELKGSVDTVYMGGFLHVFDRKEQVKALELVVWATKVGSRACGFQWGLDRTQAEEKVLADKRAEAMHDENTMRELWDRVSAETGTRWRVDAKVHAMGEFYPQERDYVWLGKGAVVVIFEAVREA